MRSESDSFDIVEAALDAAGVPEADAVLVSTDRNISRFANSNLHQNMSEVTAELVPALTERFEPWPEAVELDGQADPATACRTPGVGPW